MSPQGVAPERPPSGRTGSYFSSLCVTTSRRPGFFPATHANEEQTPPEPVLRRWRRQHSSARRKCLKRVVKITLQPDSTMLLMERKSEKQKAKKDEKRRIDMCGRLQ